MITIKKCLVCNELFPVRGRHSHYRKVCNKESCKTKRHNELVQIYRTEMKVIANELDKCTYCFKEKTNPKFKLCFACRKLQVKYYKQGKNKK